jgi:hypothetical protein
MPTLPKCSSNALRMLQGCSHAGIKYHFFNVLFENAGSMGRLHGSGKRRFVGFITNLSSVEGVQHRPNVV